MAEIILGILRPLIGQIGEYLVNPIKNQLSYLCCYSCNVRRLANQVPELNSIRESVQEDVDAAEDNLGVILPEVQRWLSEVEAVQTRSNRICNEAEAQNGCLSKWCPLLHYSLSRDAQKTTEASIVLRNTRPERISNPAKPANLKPIPAKFEFEFKSRDLIEKNIMDALKDDSVYSIGLCGMGGVGKTTMARKIEERAREKTQDSGFMFERVVMSVVSEQPNLTTIQQQIAAVLGLQLNQVPPTDEDRAKLLHTRLMAAKNVLIILDDVWDRLDLDKIGIPSKSTLAGFKLLLTSRNQDAITKTVGEDGKVFSLQVLSDEESWTLFRKTVGDSIDSPDLHQVAREVAAECKRLPLALVTLGCTLAGCPEKSCWEDTLLLLQSMPTNIPDVLKDVYGPLRLSFNRLESEEYRYLFLLCCLFPEDYKISLEELVTYGTGLGILKGRKNLRETRNGVKRIVDNLITRSLCIESGTDNWGNQCVKMHDIIRDMGIYIASPEGKRPEDSYVFMISHGKKEWPKEDSYANYTCISLSFSEADIDVPECIDCPRLEFLNMNFRGYFELPENIFDGMTKLKVLETSGIKSLPSSVDKLKGLRTLRLSYCKLKDTSVIGKLMNLEILRLRCCKLEVFPKEIGGLKKLRKLEVLDCDDLRRIEFGVVSGLVRLEELVILNSFSNWKAEQKDDASLVELDSLSHLTTLYIEISDPNIIPKRTPYWVQKVMKYYLFVCGSPHQQWEANSHLGFEKAIILGGGVTSPLGNWFCDMAVKAKYLNLGGLSCTEIVNKLVRLGYQNLEYLRLRNFNNIQYLSGAITFGQQNGGIFPTLKYLGLKNSSSFQGVSNCLPSVGSFQALQKIRLENLSALVHLWIFPREGLCPLPNLKIMVINNCGSLLDLFPLSMAESLSQLEKLRVSDCEVLEEIFKTEEGGMEITINKIEFPKLFSLKLVNLPSLRGFCEGVERIEVPALDKLIICNLSGIKREDDHDLHQQFLFNKQLSGVLITPLRNTFNFSGLQELEVDSLHNIKSLFSPSIFSGVPNLRELTVKNCTNLEEVIGKDEDGGSTTLFPQLKKLVLSKLPKIFAFCYSTSELELPSLQTLEISDCPLMETFVIPSDVRISRTSCQSFFSKEVYCRKLNDLVLKGLNIVGIFSHSIPIQSFCELKSLRIKSCQKLTNLFSLHVFRGLRNINELHLEDCGKLQEVIAKEDEERPINIKETLSFQLKYLRLLKLPKMRRVYNMSNDLELPSLRILKIQKCSMLETFTLGSLHLPSLERVFGDLDPDFAAKLLFNKQKSSDKIDLDNNCFTFSTRDLSFTMGRWLFSQRLERDSSDSFVSVVEVLASSSTVEIKGNLEMEKLSVGVVYEIIFIIMLLNHAIGWEEPVELKLTKAGGIAQYRTEILDIKPKEEWIEILVGEFTRESDQIGQLEFSFNKMDEEDKRGLIIKGGKIRQKV